MKRISVGNRILSMILSLVMVLSCSFVNGTVFAEEGESYDHMTRYDWYKSGEDASNGVILTAQELKEHVGCDADSVQILVTDEAGMTDGANPYARINGEGDLVYQNHGVVGSDVFYFVVQDGENNYGPVAVDVYVYGVRDASFVLDYSLPVLLSEQELVSGDQLTVNGAPEVSCTVTVEDLEPEDPDVNKKGAYGTFSETDSGLVYTMDSFLNGVDSIDVIVRIAQSDVDFVEGVTGVTMTKTVRVVPASVMYYEDDSKGIVYVNTDPAAEDGNLWTVYGEQQSTYQSADQTSNYGFDPAYDVFAGDGELFLSTVEMDKLDPDQVNQDFLDDVGGDINEALYGDRSGFFSIYGDASNGTVHVMNIKHAKAAELLHFEFTGTGFEIISRTTMDPYAVLTVKVEAKDGDSYKTVRALPVITACSSGDLNQIPVVACKDMEYGTYRITVISSNVEGIARMVYLDGIRVYQPLEAATGARYYQPDEADSHFYEIQNEIRNGNIVYGQVIDLEDTEGTVTSWQFGSTMIENQDPFATFILTNTDPTQEPDAYLKYGPANEIYLSNAVGSRFSYIAFYVTKDESYVGERSIQVGAHLMYTGNSFNDDYLDIESSVRLIYGFSAADFTEGDAPNHTVVSGTEMYYDVCRDTLATLNANGSDKALVIIGTDDQNGNVLSLTNLKLNGYTIAEGTAAELMVVQDSYDINASYLMSQTAALYTMVKEDSSKEEGGN